MVAEFVRNDGGRAEAGFRGTTGDCVCRSISIASGKPYREVYDALNAAAALERPRKGRTKSSSRTGVHRRTYEPYLLSLGFRWVPTMRIGQGCKVHLRASELPGGRLVVVVSGHLTAVIDGVIHDLYDPRRDFAFCEPDNGRELKPGEWRNVNGIWRQSGRCVYGYYVGPAV